MRSASVIALMTLAVAACDRPNTSASIPDRWLGEWAETSDRCADSTYAADNLTITQDTLSFGNETGRLLQGYGNADELLIVTESRSDEDSQFRAYSLSMNPSGSALAVDVDGAPTLLVRCSDRVGT